MAWKTAVDAHSRPGPGRRGKLVVILIVSVAVPCFRRTGQRTFVAAPLDLAMVYRSGLTSCVFFIWQTFLRRDLPDYGASAAESLVFLVLAAASIGLFVASHAAALPAAEPFCIRAAVDVWTAAGEMARSRLSSVASALHCRIAPHGIEDAVSIWNLASLVLLSGRRSLDRRLPAGELAWGLSSARLPAVRWPAAGPGQEAASRRWCRALLGLSFSLATAAALAGGLGLIRGASAAGLIAGAPLLPHWLLSRDFGQPACC